MRYVEVINVPKENIMLGSTVLEVAVGLTFCYATVALIALWPKKWRKVPSPVFAMMALTLASFLGKWPVETIGTRFGGIPHGLPHFSWPAMSKSHQNV